LPQSGGAVVLGSHGVLSQGLSKWELEAVMYGERPDASGPGARGCPPSCFAPLSAASGVGVQSATLPEGLGESA